MMKIIMLGTRGVPANYGGFETCVEEVAVRLAKKHRVIVYARKSHYKNKINTYKNVEIVYLPSFNFKSLETLSHTFFSVIHALFFHWSAVWMIFNAANSPMLFLPWLLRRKMAINTDGLEWKRDKWGKIGKAYYQFSEWLATKFVKNIVADSKGIHEYYFNRWNTNSTIIEYGAYLQKTSNKNILNNFNLKIDKYFLQITRLEPENNPLLTIEAYMQFLDKYPHSDIKLVIVGDVTYQNEYSEKIKSFKNDNIILPGYIFDDNILIELRVNCFTYIHGNQVGGTNPALLEAMGSGSYVISRDVDFNREVLEFGGIYYKRSLESLFNKMKWIYQNQDKRNNAIQFSINKIKEYYNWDKISDKYEVLFKKIKYE